MLIAHRVELDPTDRQRTAFARAAGTARVVTRQRQGDAGRFREATPA